MQCIITGHRRQKLGGFNNHKAHKKIIQAPELDTKVPF